jgi:hypothetical protein
MLVGIAPMIITLVDLLLIQFVPLNSKMKRKNGGLN